MGVPLLILINGKHCLAWRAGHLLSHLKAFLVSNGRLFAHSLLLDSKRSTLMQRSTTKVNRMESIGECVSTQHSARARKKQKRLLSKRRRARIKAEDTRNGIRT